ncbi:MAG: hypothetical protein JW852_03720 [Spirochaetales bacterium]|nr:hypothetical protein [Spirochaetales bacterium]
MSPELLAEAAMEIPIAPGTSDMPENLGYLVAKWPVRRTITSSLIFTSPTL